MKKYLFAMLFFFPVLVQAVSVPATYLIHETLTNPNRIDYTITGGAIDDPIVAFAVGFNGDGDEFVDELAGIENFNLDWGAVALSADDWDNTLLSTVGARPFALDFSFGFQDINVSASEYFGLTWAEFLAFDNSTPNYAAIYLEAFGSGGIPSAVPVAGFFVEGLINPATPTLVQTLSGVVSGGPEGQVNTIASSNSIPVPAAVWLFGSGLIGLVGMRKK